MSPLYAAIDIGTNSAKLLVAASRPGLGGKWSPLDPVLQKVAVPRLGRGLSATGIISTESFQALMVALTGFLHEIRVQKAALVGAVATEAFRKALNGPALLAEVVALLGCDCRILPGEEEARLGFLAVSNRHDLPSLAVADVGGGSTEITTATRARSLPIGAGVLLDLCGHDLAACRARAAQAFESNLRGWKPPENLVAVGGTATALALFELGLTRFDSAAIEGLKLTAAAVGRQAERMASMTEAERAAIPGLDQGRSEIIMPGLCILEAFLRAAGLERFRVSDRGIRYGVILDALQRAGADD